MLTIFKCHVAHGTVCQTVAYAAVGPSLHIFLTALQVSWMPPLRSARLRTGRFRIIKVFAANRLGCLRGMGWSLSVDNIGLQEGERPLVQLLFEQCEGGGGVSSRLWPDAREMPGFPWSMGSRCWVLCRTVWKCRLSWSCTCFSCDPGHSRKACRPYTDYSNLE